MNLEAREALERSVRGTCDAGRHDEATAAALRGYGPEIFDFLAALHRSEPEAAEVFSLFAEGLWRGLPTFAWESTLRTWAYAIARRSSLRHRRDAHRRGARVMGLPDGVLPEIAAQVRSETASYLRTQPRSRIAELRGALPAEDQALLLLRADRGLAWNELARVLHEDAAEPLSDETLKREAARLRKRFQLVKEKLYEMARSEGLVGAERGGR